jgi:Bacterial Ig-like domain (group 3)
MVRASKRRLLVFGLSALFALSSAGLLLAGPAQAAPTGTQPTITPPADSTTTSPQQGDTLTDVSGTWTGTGTVTVTYQWMDCDSAGSNCQPVAANGNAQTYVVAATDVTHTIEVQEIATDSNPGSTTVTSAPTLVVGLPPSKMTAPTIAGTAQQGQTLTETNGTWSNNPTSYSHQWMDCDPSGNNCGPILGAHGSTYVPTANDVHATIEVQEVASNPGGPGVAADSAPTAPIAPLPPPVNSQPPTIAGTPAQGQTLVDLNGLWTPTPSSFIYQWSRCDLSGCAPIPGAQSKTYTLTTHDPVGDTIEVAETGVDSGGPGMAAVSPPTLPIGLNSSTTALLALPGIQVTNQTMTLIATVTSSFSSAPPTGTVAFSNVGGAISGCSSLGVATLNQSVNITCRTAFSASTSPEHVTAIFTPAAGSSVAGSRSQSVRIVVGKDVSSTALDVSHSTVNAGSTDTYTATVAAAQSGPFHPSGSVEFFDHRKPISACSRRRLALSRGHSSAHCTVRYRTVGAHAITARYRGDGGFAGSNSSRRAVSIRPVSIRVQGTIKARMLWTFRFTPTYTKVLAMVAREALVGTQVIISCRGRRCPFASRSILVTKATGCSPGASPRCLSPRLRTVDLASRFGGQRLPAGSLITIEFTRPGWIGKAYVFTIHGGRAPTDRILCLAPGSTRAGAGC